jgi:hypothetical protein
MYKVYVKLGAGFEDGSYCWNNETTQTEFSSQDEGEGRAFLAYMRQLFPEVTYELHYVNGDDIRVVPA